MAELEPDGGSGTLTPAVYEHVFYSIQNPALVIDLEFVIRDANQAAVDFLEYQSQEDLRGTPVEQILATPSILDDVGTQIAQQEFWSGEAEILTAEDRIRLGVGTAAPIDVDGAPQLIAGVFTDMTERRRYTNSLKILNRILRHNIRNDVTRLLGSFHRIATEADDEDVVTAAEEAQSTLEDIVGYADTARELEFLLREGDEPALETHRLDRVLETVLADIVEEYDGAKIEYPDDLPEISVIALDSITRAIREVIENGVAHNDADDPRVRVSIEQSETAVQLHVADDGPGVPAAQHDLIFGREELGQLHHGNGFSLYFVDQVMDVIGGDVWVEDGDLGGATFVLEFPRPR